MRVGTRALSPHSHALLNARIIACMHAERTCFATSLARLVRLPGPARVATSQQLLREDDAANAPREIMRLVNWLMTEATAIVSVC